MIRLMQVLLHAGPTLTGWRTAQIHHRVLATFGLDSNTYTLHPAALRPAQDEGTWPSATGRGKLALPPHPQGKPRLPSLCPLPPAYLWAPSQYSLPSLCRLLVSACHPARGGLPQGRPIPSASHRSAGRLSSHATTRHSCCFMKNQIELRSHSSPSPWWPPAALPPTCPRPVRSRLTAPHRPIQTLPGRCESKILRMHELAARRAYGKTQEVVPKGTAQNQRRVASHDRLLRIFSDFLQPELTCFV